MDHEMRATARPGARARSGACSLAAQATAILAALAAAAVLATPAVAQNRPDSLKMTCAHARAFVAQRGEVILGTGPHVYDRIVSDARFCPWPQTIHRTTVQTRDVRNCFVGYVCRDGRPDWPWLDD